MQNAATISTPTGLVAATTGVIPDGSRKQARSGATTRDLGSGIPDLARRAIACASSTGFAAIGDVRRGTTLRERCEAYAPAFTAAANFCEELVRHFLGGAVDQALAELRELAADLRVDVVGQQRAAILVGEPDVRAALGEARDAAVALAEIL